MKQDYLKWAHEKTIGAVSTHDSAITSCGKQKCFISSGDQIIEWNLKSASGTPLMQLEPSNTATSLLFIAQSDQMLAYGENDGAVSIVELVSKEIRATFKGHTSAISSLAYSSKKLLLASGSKDSKICIWDVASESGLFKLHGHKGEITSLNFVEVGDEVVLISTSRDGFVKFWDLNTQHCFRTLIEHSGSVWKAVVFKTQNRMATVSADGFLRVWKLEPSSSKDEKEPYSKQLVPDDSQKGEENQLWDEVDSLGPLKCQLSGQLELPARGPPRNLEMDNSGQYLVCARRDTLLFYKIRSEEEIRKKDLKRAKKRSKEDTDSVVPTVPSELKPSGAIKMSNRPVSCYAYMISDKLLRITAAFSNNLLESVIVSLANESGEPQLQSNWHLPPTACGHQGTVRGVSFSSESSAIMSVGADYLKLWNRRSGTCIRTLYCPGVTCGVFLPGDHHVLVGNENGSLITINLGSGEMTVAKSCHDGNVSSVALSPNRQVIASCGADKKVRFWGIHVPLTGPAQLQQSSTGSSIDVVQERILELEDEPIKVVWSPDGRLIAIALLDSTVRVFYTDTLRFFVSLYGHKLPVTSLAISSDSTLIVTGSRDRNIKIWGLDFGDCHRSIFAHDEAVVGVEFLPKTHQFFSAGLDNKLNRWDADVGQLISSHHQQGITCLAASPLQKMTVNNEQYLVTGANDGSLRFWRKTDEILVVSEEREKQEEKAIAEAAAQSNNQPVEPAGLDSSASAVIVPTVDALQATEDLIEAVDVWRREQQKILEGEKAEPELLVKALGFANADEMVGETVAKIKPTFLQPALLRLPVSTAADLIRIVSQDRVMSRQPELMARVQLFLLRLHNGRLPDALSLLGTVRESQLPALEKLRRMVGTNLAGLQMLAQAIEDQQGVVLFEDLAQDKKARNRNKKKSKVLIAAAS